MFSGGLSSDEKWGGCVSKMTGYKGFDKDLKCKDYQFEVGKEYIHEGDVKLCQKGFHFCEHPLDVFGYYSPVDSRFAEVEAEDVLDQTERDTKRVCKTLYVKAEITFEAIIKAAIKFTFDRADWSQKEDHVTADGEGSKTKAVRGAASATGDRGAASATGYSGAASATGYSGAASATGYSGAASATGYRGAASATGKEGCAVALGIEGKAKGTKRTWLTIAEWKTIKDEWHRVDVQTVQVDDKTIKADTWYWLKDGKFVEVV
jgi:hypothetical protein